jgi:hypothetical protein
MMVDALIYIQNFPLNVEVDRTKHLFKLNTDLV